MPFSTSCACSFTTKPLYLIYSASFGFVCCFADYFESQGLVLDKDVFIRLSFQEKHGNNFNLKEENLFVKTCFVDEGIVMKRAKMDSRGHVGRNDHKTSHITVIVAEK